MSDETEEVVEGAPVAEGDDSETEVDESEDQSEEQEGDPSESPTEKPKKGAAARIEELNRNWRETERDRDYWREMALKGGVTPQQQGDNQAQQVQQPAQKSQEPLKTLADFDYDEEAHQSYMVEELSKRATEAARTEFQNQQSELQAQQRRQTFNQREQDFAKTVDDYGSVTRQNGLFVTNEMVDLIQSSEIGPELAYYLGKNASMTQQIERLPPLQMAMEVGRIQAQLIADKKASKQSSKAPPPPPKLDGVSANVSKDPDDMTMEEWIKHRNKQLAKNKGK